MSGTKRISALTELASGSVDEDDILAIVDMSQASVTDKTKHVKVKNLIAVGGRLEIDSFAELATKFVGSSPSSTQQIAATNDIVVWREKGFRYQCVTSGEHFDYTGSGGLKWKVLPGAHGAHLQAFGATGDGTTDDTTAIQAALTFGSVSTKDAGTYRATGQLTIPTGAHIDISGEATLFLDFHDEHGITSTDVDECNVVLNIIGDDTNPTGVLDALRITRATNSRFDLIVKNSHDIGVRFVDCDRCDIKVQTSFSSFRGYAAILDGCNYCDAHVRGTHTNFGVLVTGQYLSGGSESTRTAASYLGGVVLRAFIEDHEGVGVDVNGAINTVVRDSVVSGFTATSYNSNGDDFFACYQAKGGADTKGNKFINCQSIDGAISFSNFGAGPTEFIDCQSFYAQWSPVYLGNTANQTTVRGLYAEDWGLNVTSVASYGGTTYAPIILIGAASNSSIYNVVGCIKTDAPQSVAGIAVVSGIRNDFDNIRLDVMNATPTIVYGIYDNGSFNRYGDGCRGIFTATSGGATKTFSTRATTFNSAANTSVPIIGTAHVDSTGSLTVYMANMQKASMTCFASFTQTRAFGANPPGDVQIGTQADIDNVLTTTTVPNSALLNMQYVQTENVTVTAGLRVTYTLGAGTDGAWGVSLHGFTL